MGIYDTRAAPVTFQGIMGIVSLLDTVLTFTFMVPACIIAGAMIYGLDFLAKQEAAEKQISPVAASPGMELSLAELATYDGKTNGKPILVSVMGKVYDVGAGAGLYGTTGQYRAFAGKLVKKFEDVFVAKYPVVGNVTDLQNLAACPESDGVAVQADAFSVKLGTDLFTKGHIVA